MARPSTREEAQEAIDAVRRACWFHPSFTPVVYRGVFFASAETVAPKPSPGLSAQDFVLGMEALGVPLWIVKGEDGTDRLLLPPGFHLLPAHWAERAEALRTAFPISRNQEAIDFMRRRGDLAIGEEPAPDPLMTLIAEYRETHKESVEAFFQDAAADKQAWREPFERLCSGHVPVPTTLEGVEAAIRLLAEEEKAGPSDITNGVLEALVWHFDRRVAA